MKGITVKLNALVPFELAQIELFSSALKTIPIFKRTREKVEVLFPIILVLQARA